MSPNAAYFIDTNPINPERIQAYSYRKIVNKMMQLMTITRLAIRFIPILHYEIEEFVYNLVENRSHF